MKVQFYGKLADLLGREQEITIDAPCTIADLRVRLAADHPEAARALEDRRVRACVGDTLVADDQIVAPGTAVELLAPVSGG